MRQTTAVAGESLTCAGGRHTAVGDEITAAHRQCSPPGRILRYQRQVVQHREAQRAQLTVSVVAPDGNAFAFSYSSGGAIGNFHVRVFLVRGDTVTEASQVILSAVADFKGRQFCRTRGNNSADLLLPTDVYPTGDCGPDLGHAEGYVVSVPNGRIERHRDLAQLKALSGVCLQNDDGQ